MSRTVTVRGGAGRAFHALGTFFFALHVPYVSILGIGVALAPGLLWLPRFFTRRVRFVVCTLLLCGSLSSYYVVAAGYGLHRLEMGIGYAAVVIAGYLAGYLRGATAPAPLGAGAASGLLAAVTGCVGFAAASVALADPTHLLVRVAPSVWSGEPFNAPGLGGLASLGMSLLAVTAFSAPSTARARLLTWWAFPFIGIAGVLSNLALRNRTPFLALLAAFLVVGWISSRDAEVPRLVRRAQIIVGFLALALAAAVGSGWFETTEIGMRFRSEGLSTARYEVWWMILEGLPEHPWGGRSIPITEPYAHNLWLDMAWDAGVMPAVLMLAFHLAHAGPALEVFRKTSGTLKLVLSAVGVAFLVTAMGEPVPAFPIAFLALLNYLAGLTLGLRDRIRAGGV